LARPDPAAVTARIYGVELIGDLERVFAAAIYPNRVLIAAIAAVGVALLIVVARRRRLDVLARRHPRTTIAVAAAAAAVLLPSGWYLGSPLFLSSSVDEAPPVIAAATPAAARTAAASASPSSAIATPSPTPVPQLIDRSGAFRGADDFHFGKGTARLIETTPGVFTVRLESFQVRNGPDLYVYLSPSRDGYAGGAIELGPLKADRGNQNYAVPANADVTAARSVVIWCKQFSVLFATAPLAG
jgi:hypothetical protein